MCCTDPTGSVMQSDGSAGNAEVHNAGEIWANTLWELYAALLKDSRYTLPRRRTDEELRHRGAEDHPGRADDAAARDALLAVASATDDQDFDLPAKAFAKHGMGYGAVVRSL